MEPESGVKMKLRAARNKLNALQRSHDRFVASDPYEVSAKQYRVLEDPTLYVWSFCCVKKKRTPDERWTSLIDELAYHLRSALDVMIHHLSIAPGRADPDGTGFPIASDPKYFDASLIRYLRDDERTFVKGVQPYGRPDDPLRVLAKMNNRLKHRTQMFAVEAVGFDKATLSNNFEVNLTSIDVVHITYATPEWIDDGTELLRIIFRRLDDVEPHVQVKMNFVIQIRLGDRTLGSDEPIGGLMSQMVARVESIVDGLYALRPS